MGAGWLVSMFIGRSLAEAAQILKGLEAVERRVAGDSYELTKTAV